MTAELNGAGVDVGIVTTNLEPMVIFYRDVLGFAPAGELPLPNGDVLYKFGCGSSHMKILYTLRTSPVAPPGTEIQAATGYRWATYWVANIADVVADCERAGSAVTLPIRQNALGNLVAIVTDPDGNLVEFVESRADGAALS
jgi:catechol 2,3-dioxygenase-like lactoylglutathione lyase family enzyme